MSHSTYRAKGFTLIEVMITVAIIAILAAIALPSYDNYIKRGKIAEATAQLSAMRVKMEQYFQDNRTYVGACAPTTVAPVPTGDNARYFTYNCPTRTPTAFIIEAVGNAAEGMTGFTYTINQSNDKATTALPAGWGTTPTTCWIIRKGATC